jgi:hypothetical protein
MTHKRDVIMQGEGLTARDPVSIECGQCGMRLLEDIIRLDSWTIGVGWADLVWQGVDVEHVCDPQPVERPRVLLNATGAPGVVEEAIRALAT